MSIIDLYKEEFSYFLCATCGNYACVDTPVEPTVCHSITCVDRGELVDSVTRANFLSGQGIE